MSGRSRSVRMSGPDPIGTAGRRARRREKLPAGAACVFCGWVTPDLLLRTGCRLVEADHVDGDANNQELVAPACPNCHAVRTEGQRRLGVDLRHLEARSVLERQAAGLRSRAVFHRQLAGQEDEQAAELEALTVWLDREFPGWQTRQEAAG